MKYSSQLIMNNFAIFNKNLPFLCENEKISLLSKKSVKIFMKFLWRELWRNKLKKTFFIRHYFDTSLKVEKSYQRKHVTKIN